MSIYKGIPERTKEGGFKVYKDDKPLNPAYSQKIINHSPDGFAWGYGGSGPSQLALSLLLEETNKNIALQLYQPFKWSIVSGFEIDRPWELTSVDIRLWLFRHGVEPEGILC